MAKSNEMIALEQKVFKDLEREDYTVQELKNALDQGLDVNASLNQGVSEASLLAMLILRYDVDNNINFVKTLLAHNPDIEQLSRVDDGIMLPPLAVAITFEAYDMVPLFLEAGADPNVKFMNEKFTIELGGETPTIESECIEETVLMILLRGLGTVSGPGSDADLEDGVLNVIVSLLDAGAKVSLKNEDGKTALDLAQSAGAHNLIALFGTAFEKEEHQKQEAFNLKAQKQKEAHLGNLKKVSDLNTPKPRRRYRGVNIK